MRAINKRHPRAPSTPASEAIMSVLKQLFAVRSVDAIVRELASAPPLRVCSPHAP